MTMISSVKIRLVAVAIALLTVAAIVLAASGTFNSTNSAKIQHPTALHHASEWSTGARLAYIGGVRVPGREASVTKSGVESSGNLAVIPTSGGNKPMYLASYTARVPVFGGRNI